MYRALPAVVLTSAWVAAVAQDQNLPSGPPEDVSDACSAETFRQFDFWIGRWSVAPPGRMPQAVNEITRVGRGCAVQERYYNANGYTGNSLNFYDAETGSWHQLWVDSSGLVLRLEGGLDAEGRMVLSGTRKDAEGQPLRDRITWIPRADGSVRQVWDTSKDEGRTWENLYTGDYVRLSPN